VDAEYFLPLYHPAAALYNGGLREELLKDFKKIPKVLALITTKEKKKN
jgi:uracil-DNA glycosylase